MAVVAVFSSAQADTIHVDDDCPGPGDGSEANPYCSIQTAIDAAVDTDEIVVAPGTYVEAINFLGKAITLSSSDGAEVTVIDAQETGTVVTCESGEGPDTVLEGFTITGGVGTDPGNGHLRGGGMYNVLSSPTVADCTFSGNTALWGGGMYNFGGNPTLSDCTFQGNSNIGNGGGAGMYNHLSNATVTNCAFLDNSAGQIGGGIFSNFGNEAVTNCTFAGNSATVGGGMYNFRGGTTVTGCTFSNNSAPLGGGIYNNQSSPTVTRCTFRDNSACCGGDPLSTGVGGGMYNVGASSPTVSDCLFEGNTADDEGGGMRNARNSNPTVINCTFSENDAKFGGGMYNNESNPTLINCTFGGNVATEAGGAVASFGLVGAPSNPVLGNCLLWDNNPGQILDDEDSATIVEYSIVQGGWPGTGNIDADPLFVDPDNGDFRLQPGSPCIDAGDNTAVPSDITTDLDGNPRFLEIPETPDTGNGELPIVDMGAYEALGGGCLAVTHQEVVCHADGSTFTVNVEGLNACTGGTSMVTFTGSGGNVGEEACFTVLVNDGGFCCSTEICVTVPDCSPPAQADCPWDCGDGDGEVTVIDFFQLIAAWGMFGTPCDFGLGPAGVDISEFFDLIAHWGLCEPP
jgi:parallel beta-helix repeat protein